MYNLIKVILLINKPTDMRKEKIEKAAKAQI